MIRSKNAKYFDFDRQFSEMKRETITLHLFGKDYTIPASIPAVIPLELSRYDDDAGVPTKAMFKIVRALFGDQALGEWTAHPEFSANMLGEVVKTTFKLISGEDPEPEPEEITEDDRGAAPKK